METENEIELKEEKKNSINLKKDAKGNYSWELKVYFNDEPQKALDLIDFLDIELRNKYSEGIQR